MRNNFEDIGRVSPVIAHTLQAQQIQITALHKRVNTLQGRPENDGVYPAPAQGRFTPIYEVRESRAEVAAIIICASVGVAAIIWALYQSGIIGALATVWGAL